MKNKIRLTYIDEELSWQSQVYEALNSDFDLNIPETLPRDVKDLWPLLIDYNPQAILIDYRLNDSGKVSYTGDDVIKEFHKHNKHLPMFIITSFEDNALIECREAQIIRGKELITEVNQIIKLKNIIIANVNNYEARKRAAENIIQSLQEKIMKGEELTSIEETEKFNAELYLSELDLDSNIQNDLITNRCNRSIEKLLEKADQLINKFQGV